MASETLRLCYVDLPWAFFTTRDLAEQWGDDWNDAPYEHNAERPYEDWHSAREGKPLRWEIVQVAVETELSPPCEPGFNSSPWSVEQINRGDVPWLRDHYGGKHPPIMAGTTLPDFIAAIEASGGTVYFARRENEETDDGQA